MHITITKGTVMYRKPDYREFVVTEVAHWSVIKSFDFLKDEVKWLGDNDYISHSGTTYTVLPRD